MLASVCDKAKWFESELSPASYEKETGRREEKDGVTEEVEVVMFVAILWHAVGLKICLRRVLSIYPLVV